jgi:SAM-dependent methyltransferase
MFAQSARFYDALYSFVDYPAEADLLTQLIRENKKSPGNKVLDVACGTGQHISHLKNRFQIEGLDLEPRMLDIAKERNPDTIFHIGDMRSFTLSGKYDAILCMFSSIGFVVTIENLRRTAATFAHHLEPGGVIVVEPWVQPHAFIDGHVGAFFIDQPSLKVARINSSKVVGKSSMIHHQYLVGCDGRVEHFTEEHELGLFTNEEYLEAFQSAGLEARFQATNPKGRTLYNRGLYIATKPITK